MSFSTPKIVAIFTIIYLAMIANSYWEAYVEGRNPWDKHKLGWKIQVGKYCLPAYHFYLFFVMWPLLLSLPLIINGLNIRLFGILVSAYSSGLVIEDFVWWVVNPVVKFSEFGPKFGSFFPWIKFRKLQFPLPYIFGFAIAIVSWLFFWK